MAPPNPPFLRGLKHKKANLIENSSPELQRLRDTHAWATRNSVFSPSSLFPDCYLPTACSQVLQSPGRSFQRVGVRALGQQGEVGLDDRRVPQHLDPFGGVRRVREGTHAVPLCSTGRGRARERKRVLTLQTRLLIRAENLGFPSFRVPLVRE